MFPNCSIKMKALGLLLLCIQSLSIIICLVLAVSGNDSGLRRAGRSRSLRNVDHELLAEITRRSKRYGAGVHVTANVLDEEQPGRRQSSHLQPPVMIATAGLR